MEKKKKERKKRNKKVFKEEESMAVKKIPKFCFLASLAWV